MNSRDKQNAHYDKWLPQARKHFVKSSNRQMSMRISYKFPMFVSLWWFHGIVTVIIELNLMACAYVRLTHRNSRGT